MLYKQPRYQDLRDYTIIIEFTTLTIFCRFATKIRSQNDISP